MQKKKEGIKKAHNDKEIHVELYQTKMAAIQLYTTYFLQFFL